MEHGVAVLRLNACRGHHHGEAIGHHPSMPASRGLNVADGVPSTRNYLAVWLAQKGITDPSDQDVFV